MNQNDLYFLHNDTRVVPLTSISPESVPNLKIEGEQYLLSRAGARCPSIVIDKHAANLLEAFKNGRSLPHALKDLSVRTDVDPDHVVKQAYPLLKLLIREGYLLAESKAIENDHVSLQYSLSVGALFEGYTITRRLRLVEDTELYQVRLDSGRYAALKMVRGTGQEIRKAIKREAIILRNLQGTVAPELIEFRSDKQQPYIVMEWIDGYPCSDWAVRIRNMSHDDAHIELKKLAIDILEAYKVLHDSGVVHSDIHPRNVMIDLSGTVRIIDFGSSWFASANTECGLPQRANSPYFKPPDCAEAHVNKTRKKPATISSDVFSLGALLYFLLTGKPYTDFSVERNEQIRQILYDVPLSFAERGRPSWSDMEEALQHMLQKDESIRIPTVDAALHLFQTISIPQLGKGAVASHNPGNIPPTIREVSNGAHEIELSAPKASFNFGGAGIGYALLRCSIVYGDPNFLAAADSWVLRARKTAVSDPEGCLCPKEGLTAEVLGPCSILHGNPGIALVEGLLAHQQMDVVSLRQAHLKYLAKEHLRTTELEFAFGKAGLLHGLQQVARLVAAPEDLIGMGNEIAETIVNELEQVDSIQHSRVQFVGFAHGWAGILFALLSWGREHNSATINRVHKHLEELGRLGQRSQLGTYWPRRFDRPVREGDISSWCNGTAGFVLLWTEAYVATGEEKWLNLARASARHAALHQDNCPNLCCGLAGRAFSLGVLHRVTGESEWLKLALKCIERAEAHPPNTTYYPLSLFKGALGLELAKIELMQPELITFPSLLWSSYGERVKTEGEPVKEAPHGNEHL